MHFLSAQRILALNKRVLLSGGLFVPPHNLHNPNSFKYLIEAVDGEVYGLRLYPTLACVAAAYVYIINADHVFIDGNKRTAVVVLHDFLTMNDIDLRAAVSEDELVDLVIGVADHEFDYSSCKEIIDKWLHRISSLNK